jgi:hypothetical protein
MIETRPCLNNPAFGRSGFESEDQVEAKILRVGIVRVNGIAVLANTRLTTLSTTGRPAPRCTLFAEPLVVLRMAIRILGYIAIRLP